MRRALVLVVLITVLGCAFGDILNGPLPVDVTAEDIVGTWYGHDSDGHDTGGTLTFASDGSLTATDLPAAAIREHPETDLLSAVGTWTITSPPGGDPDQRNMVALVLHPSDHPDGGWSGALSAHHNADDMLVLSLGTYWFSKS